MAPSYRTCVIGSFAPLRKLIRTILEERGHEVRDYDDISQCPCLQGDHDGVCTFLLLEHSNGDSLEMARHAIEKGHIQPADIAILAFPGDEGVRETKAMGCRVIHQPFRLSELADWIRGREEHGRDVAGGELTPGFRGE